MKINKIYNIFKENEKVFQCPVCNANIKINENASFICFNGHCFDLSSKGYINFIPNQKQIKYNKDLFENREKVFLDGFYSDVLKEIEDTMLNYFKVKEPINILDAGCGEGYYALGIEGSSKLKSKVFAIDIVKDAIKIASRKQSRVKWIVGDISSIPLKEKSIDIVMDVLTPSKYSEFNRVLSDKGIVIKVIPGESYLKEIRESISEQLKSKVYSNKRVVKYFKDNMNLIERKKVKYTLPITKHQLKHFLEMTPMTFGVDISKSNISSINCITIDLEILVGTKK